MVWYSQHVLHKLCAQETLTDKTSAHTKTRPTGREFVGGKGIFRNETMTGKKHTYLAITKEREWQNWSEV